MPVRENAAQSTLHLRQPHPADRGEQMFALGMTGNQMIVGNVRGKRVNVVIVPDRESSASRR
jgi:hypothetical protein